MNAKEFKLENYSLHKTLVKSIIDPFFICDQKGIILTSNQPLLQLLGYYFELPENTEVGSIICKSGFFQHVSIHDLNEVIGLTNLGVFLRSFDGKFIFLSASFSRLENNEILCIFRETNTPDNLYSASFSQTENKSLAEELLEEKENNLRLKESLLKNSINGILIFDIKGIIKDANQAGADILGFEKSEDLINLNSGSIISIKDKASKIKQIVLEKKEWMGTIYAVRRDGRKFIAQIFVNAIADNKELISGFMVSFIDDTQRQIAQVALKERASITRSIVNTALDGIVTIRENGEIISANPAVRKIFGYNSGEIKGQNISKLIPVIFNKKQSGFNKKISPFYVEQLVGKTSEIIGWRKDGSVFPLYLSLSCSSSKNKLIYTGILHDITKQKDVEKKLRDSEEQNRVLVDNLPEALLLHKDGKVVYSNKAARTLFEIDRGYYINKRPVIDLIHPDFRESFFSRVEKIKHGEHLKPEEQKVLSLNKKVGDVEVLGIPFNHMGESTILSVFRDITERKISEEQRIILHTAINQLEEAVIISDTEGQIQYVNPAFEKISGYSYSDVIDNKIGMLDLVEDKIRADIWEVISSGLIWSGRLVNKRKNGVLYTEELTISPIRNKQGETVNYVGIKKDITNEIITEERSRHGQKMEAIGTLAGGIAHDFNNLLFAMLGYMDMALYDLDQESSAASDIKEAIKAATRAKQLVRQILTFSRQEEGTLNPMQIGPMIKEVSKMLISTLPRLVKLEYEIAEDCGLVMADAVLIHQVIINLYTNAAYAIGSENGLIKCVLEEKYVDQNFAFINRIKEGNYLSLKISDTGCGISEDVIDRIFEPFFTTKPVGDGTGMGLAVVHGIINKLNGLITVASEVNQGTVFEILLPVVEFYSADIESFTQTIETRERIMIISNDSKVRALVEDPLVRCDYQVIQEIDFYQAVRNPDFLTNKLDLVILDEDVIENQKDSTTGKITLNYPAVGFIVLTNKKGCILSENSNLAKVECLSKQFESSDLIKTVNRLLN